MKVLLVIAVLALLSISAASNRAWGITLKPNRSMMVYCQGDELILQPYNDTQMLITCREWLR